MSGRKDDTGKARFDLLPVKPLFEVVKVYTIGAGKYSDRNWEKGIKWGRVFAAMMRHAWNWWRGEKLDPEDGQHHLASVAWCALTLMEYEETHPEYDDRPTMFNAQDLAWVAGFYDGEGSVNGGKRETKKGGKTYSYQKLSIGQNNPELLYKIREILGCGKVYGPYKDKRFKPVRAQWFFQTQDRDECTTILKLIWPWLGSKKKQQALKILPELDDRSLKEVGWEDNEPLDYGELPKGDKDAEIQAP